MNTRAQEHDADVDAVLDEIGREIAGARAKLRLSQAETAKRAGTSIPRVSDVETARARVRVDTLARIARAVGLRVTLAPAA